MFELIQLCPRCKQPHVASISCEEANREAIEFRERLAAEALNRWFAEDEKKTRD